MPIKTKPKTKAVGQVNESIVLKHLTPNLHKGRNTQVE